MSLYRFRAYNFFILFHTFQCTLSEFCFVLLFFFIFWQKVSKPAKTSEKDHSFYNTVSLKIPHSSHLTLKIIWSRKTAKNFSHFTNFPANIFLFSVRKKELHCIIS